MAIRTFPRSLPQMPLAGTFNAEARPMVAAFAPEAGVEITRRRTSLPVYVAQFEFPTLNSNMAAQLRTFLINTCAGGSLTFAWRDPRGEGVYLWKPDPAAGPIQEKEVGPGLSKFFCNWVRQPSRQWWGDYAPPTFVAVPLLIADFVNGMYGAYEAGEFVKKTFAGTFNFSRSTVARFVGNDNLMAEAAINVTRFDKLNRVAVGLNIEHAVQNTLLRSEILNNDIEWNRDSQGGTMTPNDTTSPYGTLTVEKWVESGANTIREIRQNCAFVYGHKYCLSFYAKRIGSRRPMLQLPAACFGVDQTVYFNLSDSTAVVESGAPQWEIESLENDWFRISISAVPTVSAGGNLKIGIRDQTGTRTYAGDSASGMYFWGGQLESVPDVLGDSPKAIFNFASNFHARDDVDEWSIERRVPSSYIPTDAAWAERAADIASLITGVGACDMLIVDRAGVEYTRLAITAGSGWWPTLADRGVRKIVLYDVGVLG